MKNPFGKFSWRKKDVHSADAPDAVSKTQIDSVPVRSEVDALLEQYEDRMLNADERKWEWVLRQSFAESGRSHESKIFALKRIYHRTAAVKELLLHAFEARHKRDGDGPVIRINTGGPDLIPFDAESLNAIQEYARAGIVRLCTYGREHRDLIPLDAERLHIPLENDLSMQHFMTIGEDALLLTAEHSYLSSSRRTEVAARLQFKGHGMKQLNDLFDTQWLRIESEQSIS